MGPLMDLSSTGTEYNISKQPENQRTNIQREQMSHWILHIHYSEWKNPWQTNLEFSISIGKVICTVEKSPASSLSLKGLLAEGL